VTSVDPPGLVPDFAVVSTAEAVATIATPSGAEFLSAADRDLRTIIKGFLLLEAERNLNLHKGLIYGDDYAP
jgi:hypothetical protein